MKIHGIIKLPNSKTISGIALWWGLEWILVQEIILPTEELLLAIKCCQSCRQRQPSPKGESYRAALPPG